MPPPTDSSSLPASSPAHGDTSSNDPGAENVAKSKPRRLACHNCRARRVKCDRADHTCGACARLGFPCAYPVEGAYPHGMNTPYVPSLLNHGQPLVDSLEVTQAGTKRRRSRRACLRCREDKAKCSGHHPCHRCLARHLQCSNDGHQHPHAPSQAHDHSLQQHGLANSPRDSSDTVVPGQSPGQHSVTSSVNSTTALPYERSTLRQLLDSYFDRADSSSCVFLHKPSILAQFGSDSLDPILLKVICAAGARLQSHQSPGDSSLPHHLRSEWHERPDAWIREVQTSILLSMGGKRRFAHLQALVLIIKYRVQTGSVAEASELLALAARLAFTLRLNHEHPTLSHAEQESRRRLMWALFLVDKVFCGGVDELSTCPAGMMHIRLPCDDQTFQRSIASRVPFLLPTGNTDMWPPHRSFPEAAISADEDPNQLDILAYLIQLKLIRHRILRYTRQVRRKIGSSPYETRAELAALQAELTRFEKSLPAHLKMAEQIQPTSTHMDPHQHHHEDQQLLFMAHSGDASGYILLHVNWLMCHCDLHRFLIPGLREAVTQQAIDATPPAYVEQCQRACLDSATILCRFWSALYAIEGRRPVTDAIFGVAVFQVAKIVQRLQHWIPPHDRDVLKSGLWSGLYIARADLQLHVYAQRFLSDAEKVMRQTWNPLVRADATSSSNDTENEAANGDTNDEENDEEGEEESLAEQHMLSKHSVVSRTATSKVSGKTESLPSVSSPESQRALPIHQGPNTSYSSPTLDTTRRSDIDNLVHQQPLPQHQFPPQGFVPSTSGPSQIAYSLPPPQPPLLQHQHQQQQQHPYLSGPGQGMMAADQQQATLAPFDTPQHYMIQPGLMGAGPTAIHPLDYEDMAFIWQGLDVQMTGMYDPAATMAAYSMNNTTQ